MTGPAPVLPGSTLGVLGGGQLGRMFAIAARQMGYRVHVLAPDDDTPTGQVADVEIQAGYDDLDAVRRLARGVSVLTFEFENVPVAAARAAEAIVAVRPRGEVLHTTQNRLREKAFLVSAGLPVADFVAWPAQGPLPLAPAWDGPAVLKTADWGYDGRGQRRVADHAEAAAAWEAMGRPAAVTERLVQFAGEISVLAARGVDGAIACYEPFANEHRGHVLDVTVFPAPVGASTRARALEIARTVMERLDVVGVLCVEMFLLPGGDLLVNELAPRPHNSGHLTIDACVTSQFEQQVRAICGLPLGDPSPRSAAAMANLMGDLWEGGEPRWEATLGDPDVKLHLYGKREARPGRKMGHLTVLAERTGQAARRVRQARARLDREQA